MNISSIQINSSYVKHLKRKPKKYEETSMLLNPTYFDQFAMILDRQSFPTRQILSYCETKSLSKTENHTSSFRADTRFFCIKKFL